MSLLCTQLLCNSFEWGIMKRKNRKRLAADIPDDLHKDLKKVAQMRNTTITLCVRRAILLYLVSENFYIIK